jgi:serine/threonine-protein kinase
MPQPPRPPNLVQPGQRVAHYQVLGELERGGMGVVYTARDLTLGRRVALKCPLATADDPRERKRLLREARTASRVSHPHIVPIFEVLEHDGLPWLAMELVEGTSLRSLLAAGRPLPVRDILRYAEGIASALEAAHAKNVLHRDVTPSNIMVTGDGRALLTDFGLARILRISDTSSTQSRDSDLDGDRVVGTFRYMSPEQALGKPLDARSDLFSLGAVIYEMCAGAPAVTGEGPEALDALLHRPPVPVSRLNYQVPEELERIVRKSLAKDPDERYQTARDLVADLRALRRRLEHEDYVEVHVAAPPARRARWLVAAAVLAVVAALVATRPLAREASGTAPAVVAAGSAGALAIVPFENATGDSGWTHLAEGVTDDVTRELQRSGVMVKSRQSAGQLRSLGDAEIGQRLGIDRVARGRISLDGGDILLEARLVRPSTGADVWKRTYRQPIDRLGGLYVMVAEDIAAVAPSAPTVPSTGRPSIDPGHRASFRAYEAYHKGRVYWEQRTKEGFLKSIDYFKEATRLDPDYAQAWVGMADAYLGLGVYSSFRPQEARRLGNEAAIKALALDPNLAEVHTSVAYGFYMYDWNWAAAEAEFQKAIQLNPQYATAHHWYADYLTAMGRPREALREIQTAAQLEPLSTLIQRDVAWHYFFQRRYEAAIAQLNETLRLDPRYVVARSLLGRVLIEAGRAEEGLVELQKAAPDLPRASALAFVAYGEAAVGRAEQSQATLEKLFRSPDRVYMSPYFVALVYTRLGKPHEALQWLEKGFESHDAPMANVSVDPRLESLHSEPRFQSLLRKMDFPDRRPPAVIAQKESARAHD